MNFKGLKRTVVDTVEPVSLETVKAHLRVSGATEDDLIGKYIKAAREYCETYCNRSFVKSTWKISLDCFPDGPIFLPMGPVRGILSIKYLTAIGGDPVTLTGFSSDLLARVACIGAPQSGWPRAVYTPGSVVVEFESGPTDPLADNPSQIVSAILLLVEHYYANRSASVVGTIVADAPFGVTALCDQMKIGW